MIQRAPAYPPRGPPPWKDGVEVMVPHPETKREYRQKFPVSSTYTGMWKLFYMAGVEVPE
jgi:hypothetical protein